jgi:hypothetical protein
MANQIITTTVNYDTASIGGLLDGESITINGGALTIDADTRWNQQAAVFGNIPVSPTLGGIVRIDGTQIWEISFTSSTGNVPTQNALGSNGVTGGTSGATGELTRVWASGSFTPATAGGAMPSAGFIKLRSKTGNFQAGETITLPGGAIIVATSAGKRSWIHVVGTSGSTMTTPRMADSTLRGDWYEIGTTDGSDNQTIQMPARDEYAAVQIETSVGSGVYEWWANAGDTWNGWYVNSDLWTTAAVTLTRNLIAGPTNHPASDRLRETTAASATHGVFGVNLQAAQMDAGSYTHSAIVKQETRQWCVVQISTNTGADRYGVLVDLAAGTIIGTPTLGTPTGTSSSITSLGGGYYQVNVTLNHTTGNLSSFIALSNSATPTYSPIMLPVYTGVITEGIYLGLSTVTQATHAFITTEEARGKFFYSDPFAGTIQLAKRGTNNAGFKPVSGLKIRIPNVILGTSTSGDYTAQYVSGVSPYFMNISSGVFDADTVLWNWYHTNVRPSTFTLKNSGVRSIINILNFATEVRGCCFAPSLYAQSGGTPLSFQNSANCFVYDSRLVRRVGIASSSTASANIRVYRTRFEQICNSQGKSQRYTLGQPVVNFETSGGEFVDCTLVNGGAVFNVQNYSIKNVIYCDSMTGTTPAQQSYAVGVRGSNIVVDGITQLAGVANNHPYSGYVYTTAFTSSLVIKNVGTLAAPLNGGTVNPCGYIFNSGAAGTTYEMRRCYVDNLRQGVVALATAAPVVSLYDVWGGGTTPQTISTADVISRGGKWTNSRNGIQGNSGSHWDDAYDSSTTGRITIMANEPTSASSAQCSATLGLGSGFNGSGSMIISKLTDVVAWTTPLKMYGHNFLAGGCALAGTDCQNLIFEYKIDTGSGYGGSWTFLANTVRRASGGTSGTNTVTVNTADRTALTRQPQIGDFVQSGTFKLPANTTVTNVSGNIITCSNNFTGNLANNEFVTFSPVNVAVSAANGYSLQVRTYPTAAAATTLLTAFSIGIQTDATAQQTQHPLPAIELTLTGIISGSDVVVLQADTETVLSQVDQNIGSSWIYDYEVPTVVDIFVSKAGYVPFYIRNYNLSSTNASLPIAQVIDRNFIT